MTNQVLCLRCLAQGHHRPVPLTADTYTCPACGFTAQVERLSLADLGDRPAIRLERLWWAGDEAHCLERVKHD